MAEKLGRKWIAADIGKFAIQTTKKRIMEVQQELAKKDRAYRPFALLHPGKYGRAYLLGLHESLNGLEKKIEPEKDESAFADLILRAYKAKKIKGAACFQGKKQGGMVAIAPFSRPVNREFIARLISECCKHHIGKADLLGFEFELNMFPELIFEARRMGVELHPKYIPVEIFEKRAVEREQIVFHSPAHIEARPLYRNNQVAIELTHFSLPDLDDHIDRAEACAPGLSENFYKNGQLSGSSNKGIKRCETWPKGSWANCIDYWAVDYDFESKREMIAVENPDTGNSKEQWTGGFIFQNEWQSFRTRLNRQIKLISGFKKIRKSRQKAAILVVDIFGNSSMRVIAIGRESGIDEIWNDYSTPSDVPDPPPDALLT